MKEETCCISLSQGSTLKIETNTTFNPFGQW